MSMGMDMMQVDDDPKDPKLDALNQLAKSRVGDTTNFMDTDVYGSTEKVLKLS